MAVEKKAEDQLERWRKRYVIDGHSVPETVEAALRADPRGYAEVDDIDRVNIYHAGLLAMHRAVIALAVSPEALLIDTRKLRDIPVPQQSIVHGDEKSLSIAAASILAKTTRDGRMVDLDRVFPGYGFAQHKGYPVPEHYAALERLGACAAHRRSFGPVRRAMGLMVEEEHDVDEA